MKDAFDNRKYLKTQQDAFEKALKRDAGKPTFVEFGGKPFTDRHAERVLPGYEADAKAEILKEAVKLADVVMVVNALDILLQPDGRTLRGRIRGYTNLFYDDETVRLLKDAHGRNLPISKVVLSVTPRSMSSENKVRVERFRSELERMGVSLHTHYQISGYPNPLSLDSGAFKDNDVVIADGGNLVAISPGGGSGKFGMLLSEMYAALAKDETPGYLKFETFPIFQLDAQHALNLAFEAATADLRNRVVDLEMREGEKRTSYDKDIENFALLRRLFELFGKDEELSHMQD